jgi:hypothetical protein
VSIVVCTSCGTIWLIAVQSVCQITLVLLRDAVPAMHMGVKTRGFVVDEGLPSDHALKEHGHWLYDSRALATLALLT